MDQIEKCTLLQPQGVNPETLHSYSTLYRPLAIKSPVIHVQTHNYSFSPGPLMFPHVCAMREFFIFSSISQHTAVTHDKFHLSSRCQSGTCGYMSVLRGNVKSDRCEISLCKYIFSESDCHFLTRAVRRASPSH